MRAVLKLLGFLVPISFCKNERFLAVASLDTELHRPFWFSLSLLLPSETCLLISLNQIFTLSDDSLLVTSSCFGWECALGSSADDCCSTLWKSCGFLRAKLISLCSSPSLCKISSRLRRSASACISIACLVEAGEMISRISYGMLQALCSVDNPDNSLFGSIIALRKSFQAFSCNAPNVESHLFLCKL